MFKWVCSSGLTTLILFDHRSKQQQQQQVTRSSQRVAPPHHSTRDLQAQQYVTTIPYGQNRALHRDQSVSHSRIEEPSLITILFLSPLVDRWIEKWFLSKSFYYSLLNLAFLVWCQVFNSPASSSNKLKEINNNIHLSLSEITVVVSLSSAVCFFSSIHATIPMPTFIQRKRETHTIAS